MTLLKQKKEMEKHENKFEAAAMRQKAKELLKNKPSKHDSQLSEAENLKIIHELQVSQIELEMLNDELKSRNEELRESEARFRLLSDNAPVLIWKAGIDALCDYFNKPWLKFTGRTMEQEMGNGWAEGVHPDDFQGCLDKYLGAFRIHQPFIIEYRLRRNDGEYRWLLDHGVPRFTPDGQFAGYIGSCVEITESKQAAAQLAIMADLLQEAQEIGNIGSFSYDVVCDQHHTSPQMDRIFGYAPDQEKNARAWSELLHPDDRQAMEALAAECIEHGVPYDQDYRIIRDGQIRWIRSICKAEKDPRGRVVRFSGVNIDISDRKQALMLQEQTRHNYETFFNTIDDLLFVLDENGNVIHTNSTVIDRLGYTREELFGKSVLMVHPPERRAEAGRIVGEMLSGVTAFCPVPVISKSGVMIPVETRVSRGVWNGEPAIFGVTKDISTIRLSEEKFSKLFHLNPSACGTSSQDDHTYLEVNEAFCTLFGFDRNEVIGETAFSLGIMTTETANSVLASADDNGRIYNAEASLKAKNGEIRQVLMSSENFYVQDKKYRFTVAQDISRQKQIEQVLRENSENLRIIIAEKNRFFSIIAHDLRGPFNGFLGFTQLMVDDLSGMTQTELEKIALVMRNSALNLFSLLNNLLDWARLNLDLIKLNSADIQLLPAVNESIAILSETVLNKGMDITISIPESLMVFADINVLQTVIRNLVSNAVKFTPKGGAVIISARIKGDDSVEISIKDTGIGMSRTMVEELFQLDANTGRKGTEGEPSTGLGLILCRDFIDKSGGRLWVESFEGTGTTFYFTLPKTNKSESTLAISVADNSCCSSNF